MKSPQRVLCQHKVQIVQGPTTPAAHGTKHGFLRCVWRRNPMETMLPCELRRVGVLNSVLHSLKRSVKEVDLKQYCKSPGNPDSSSSKPCSFSLNPKAWTVRMDVQDSRHEAAPTHLQIADRSDGQFRNFRVGLFELGIVGFCVPVSAETCAVLQH